MGPKTKAKKEDIELEIISPFSVKVVNKTYEDPENHTYVVSITDRPIECNCPDRKYRERKCKHMHVADNDMLKKNLKRLQKAHSLGKL